MSQPKDASSCPSGVCEYVKQDNAWWLVNPNPEPGYYCPSGGYRGKEPVHLCDGQPSPCYLCAAPERREQESAQASADAAVYFAEYEFFRDHNAFLIVDGRCELNPATGEYESYCPVDLLAYLRHHGSAPLASILQRAGPAGMIQRIRIPACSISGCTAHGPH